MQYLITIGELDKKRNHRYQQDQIADTVRK
jgi:hypothetical protein